MRRRRQTLQVSTFPFLAVLLCAMGSLILLLLVLDRRAKVVARAKAREQQMAVLAQHSKAEEDRQKDYERKRDALRRRLQEQEAALHASLDGLQSQIAKKKLETSQERSRTREAPRSRLRPPCEVVAGRKEQEGYEQTQKQVAAVSTSRNHALTEQEGLARELMRLEHALADVMAFPASRPGRDSIPWFPISAKEANRGVLFTSSARPIKSSFIRNGSSPKWIPGMVRVSLQSWRRSCPEDCKPIRKNRSKSPTYCSWCGPTASEATTGSWLLWARGRLIPATS